MSGAILNTLLIHILHGMRISYTDTFACHVIALLVQKPMQMYVFQQTNAWYLSWPPSHVHAGQARPSTALQTLPEPAFHTVILSTAERKLEDDQTRQVSGCPHSADSKDCGTLDAF